MLKWLPLPQQPHGFFFVVTAVISHKRYKGENYLNGGQMLPWNSTSIHALLCSLQSHSVVNRQRRDGNETCLKEGKGATVLEKRWRKRLNKMFRELYGGKKLYMASLVYFRCCK